MTLAIYHKLTYIGVLKLVDKAVIAHMFVDKCCAIGYCENKKLSS